MNRQYIKARDRAGSIGIGDATKIQPDQAANRISIRTHRASGIRIDDAATALPDKTAYVVTGSLTVPVA